MKKTVSLRSLQKPAILIRFNLLQVCPSVLTFVFAVLLIPSFNILRDYFFVSLNLEAVPIVRILIKFKTDTAPSNCSNTLHRGSSAQVTQVYCLCHVRVSYG